MERKLTTQVEVTGAEAAAEKFGKVAAAEEKVVAGQAGTAAGAEAATEATGKLNASTEDLVTLLAGVSPALGAFADTLVKGSKVAGDLATQNINLAGSHKKAAAFAREHGNTLKLLAAGGAVVLGITAIVNAVQTLKESHAAAEAAAKKQTDVLNEQIAAVRELEKGYQAAANARKLHDAIGVDETTKGTAQSRRIAKRYGIDAGLAATVGGELAGTDIDAETQASYTMLREAGQVEGLDATMPSGVRATMVQQAVSQNAEWVAQDRKRREEQRRRFEQDVSHQSRLGAGGRTDALERFVREQIPDVDDERAGQLAELIQKFGGSHRGFREAVEEPAYVKSPMGLVPTWSDKQRVATEDPGFFAGTKETVAMGPMDINQMDRLLNALEGLVNDGGGAPTIVGGQHFHQQPDPNAVTNGESFNRDYE